MKMRGVVCDVCGIDFLEPSIDWYFNGVKVPPSRPVCSDACKRKQTEQNWERIFAWMFPETP